jgi:hypothetical protein
MRTILTAAAAFTLVAVVTGHLTPGPHWRDVAADLHQAQPQAKVKAELHALFQAKV